MPVRMSRQIGTSLLAIAFTIVGAQFSATTALAQQDESASQPQSDAAKQVAARAQWTKRLQQAKRPAPGCYTANYPEVSWTPVVCGKALDHPFLPAGGPGHAFTIGGGSGDFTARTAAVTTGAQGRFISVNAGITETGLVGNAGSAQSNTYSLQLNTDFFQTTACSGLAASCRGWEQFIYVNEPSQHYAFIQYWMVNALGGSVTSCPTGWMIFSPHCYRNSATTSLPGGQAASTLASVIVNGSADTSGDQVIFTPSSGPAVTVVGVNAVPALSPTVGWHDSEFNIFGDGNGGAATFGANTTMTVQTLTHSGTTAAPSCVTNSYTGETNNLTLVGMSPVGTLPSPGIEFTQSNVPGTAAACMVAAGLGDTHLSTFGGLFYDFQATGDFTLALSGRFEVQTRQTSGAPNWPNAAVNQAVAARLGKSEVALCSPDPEQQVIINGVPSPISDGQIIDLGDGSGIRRVGNIIVMMDPQGNSLSATLNGNHINAKVGMGRWPVRVQGLLSSGGRSGNQLTARNGTVFNAPFALATLYGKYGDSWRVLPKRSMLKVCGPAKESANPRGTFTTEDLNPELADRARQICANQGLKDKALMEACMIDVAMLGEPGAKVYGNMRSPLRIGRILRR